MKATLRRTLTGVLIGACLGQGSAPALADDIDIYSSANPSVGGTPYVMLSIDWRPNLTSTVCNNTVEVDGETKNECYELLEEGYLASAPTDFYSLLKATLKRVLESPVIANSPLRIGLMLNHDDGSGPSCAGPHSGVGRDKCTNGGMILKGFTPVSSSTDRQAIYSVLDTIPPPQGNLSHVYQGAELFFELFRYLTGQLVYNGHNGWEDFGTNDDFNLHEAGDQFRLENNSFVSTPQWDPNIQTHLGNNSYQYISPLSGASGCGTGVYTINFLFQAAQQEADSNSTIELSYNAGGMGDPDEPSESGLSLQGNLGPAGAFGKVIGYLHDAQLEQWPTSGIPNGIENVNVTSYFYVSENQADNNTTNGYARAGGTGSARALSTDPDDLYRDLNDTFTQILSVSTTLVSPSLPLNVFNRVDLVDDVYLAIFRADPDVKPFWNGNLKKLRLGEDSSGDPILLDAKDPPAPAVNPLDGRISATALTLWTHPEDVPAPPAGETDWVQGADGRATDQGGAGSVIPGFRPITGYSPGLSNPSTGTTTSEAGPRRLYTETTTLTSGAANLLSLDATDALAETLLTDDDELFKTVLPDADCTDTPCDTFTGSSATDQAEAVSRMVDLLKFARGFEDADGDGDVDDKRGWFMADPLHSRPQPVNYGGATEDSQDIRILMASNDGYLHMFGGDDGVEDWAFMPRAVMPVLKRLRDNNTGTPIHPYTVDGSPSTLVVDTNRDGLITANSSDIAIAFVGLRRGGKEFYALDVSDPDDPELLWRITPDSTGFSQLAQSWSRPSPMFVKTTANPQGLWVVAFGGGFNGDDDGDDIPDPGSTDLDKDERNDADPSFVGSNDYEGNAIYVVNALTGDLVWKATGPASSSESVTTGSSSATHFRHAELRDSIAAQLSVTNAVPDNFDDRAYVGDTGGMIWRIDMLDPSTANWKITKVLSAGRHYMADESQTPNTLNDRRFLHEIDVVRAQDGAGEFDAVVVASGNRPHPTSNLTADYLYMIKDRTISTAAVDRDTNHDDLQDLSNNCLQDGNPADCIGVTNVDDDNDANTPPIPTLGLLQNGWKMKLQQCENLTSTGNCGEKGLSKPTTFLGKVFFTSYIPPGTGATAGVCAPSEGTGLKYVVSLQDATAVRNFNTANDPGGDITYERFEKLASGGIPSNIIRIGTQNNKTVFINPDLTFDFDVDLSYLRTYWYQNVTK